MGESCKRQPSLTMDLFHRLIKHQGAVLQSEVSRSFSESSPVVSVFFGTLCNRETSSKHCFTCNVISQYVLSSQSAGRLVPNGSCSRHDRLDGSLVPAAGRRGEDTDRRIHTHTQRVRVLFAWNGCHGFEQIRTTRAGIRARNSSDWHCCVRHVLARAQRTFLLCNRVVVGCSCHHVIIALCVSFPTLLLPCGKAMNIWDLLDPFCQVSMRWPPKNC